MKSIFKNNLVVSVVAIALVAASFLMTPNALAIGPDESGADTGIGGLVPCSGDSCNFCEIVKLGNEIITTLISLAFVFFGILFIYSGLQLVLSGGNTSKLEDAKKKLTNALIGLIIIFAAWLVVDTLLKATLSGGQTEFGPWSQIECADPMPLRAASPGCTDMGDGNELCDTEIIPLAAPPPEGYTCEPDPNAFNGDLQTCRLIRPLGSGDSGGDTGTDATADTSSDDCTIPPLRELVDPLAIQMENGNKVIWENTDPQLRICAQKFGDTVVSAYRPAEYQAHLKAIHVKWCDQGLSRNTDPACAARKSEIQAEMSKHGLSCSRPVATNSLHTSGLAIDVSPGNREAPANTCLQWYGPRDRVHYTLIPGCTCN